MNRNKKFLFLIIVQFTLSFVLVLPSYSFQQNKNIITVSPTEAADLIEKYKGNTDFVVLDIRTPGEYRSGHSPNSILIDFYSKEFVYKISQLEKIKTYLLHCRSGNRTGRSLELFRKIEFKRIYHMEQGIIGWELEGLPVIK